MDYKKIIAATAVTSAAFVAPMVVGAEETAVATTNLIADGTYSVGDTISLAILNIKTTTPDASGVDVEVNDKIVSYEWYIGDATAATSKAADFKIPIQANNETVKLIVTTTSGAKYTQSISIEDTVGVVTASYSEAKVNSTLSLSGIDINDEDEIITGYEWYLVENGKSKLLSGENELDLDIPIEYSGKELLFVVNTESGKKFKLDNLIKVTPLEVDLSQLEFSVKINGNLISEDESIPTLLPGDQIEIITPEIYGNGGQLITSEDYEIQYKWLARNNTGNLVALPNATGNVFVIPTDSEKKQYSGFNLKISVEIPSLDDSENYDLEFEIEDYSEDPGQVGTIQKLISDLESINDYELLKSNIEAAQKKYNALNSTAKLSISNYALLNNYSQAIKVVEPLVKQLDELNTNYVSFLNEGSITQAELLKQANKLRQSVNKLTAIQKKVFGYAEATSETSENTVAELHEFIVKIAENPDPYLTDKAVLDFNEAVLGIDDVVLGIYDESNQSYSFDSIEELDGNEDNLASLTAFEKEVKKQLDQAKTINKAYHSLLKLDVLKTAQSDIKKARKVVETVNKIAATSDLKKKASAIIAAEKAYNKLNFAQSSLIFEETLKLLQNPYTEEEKQSLEALVPETIETLNEDIAGILPVDNAYDSDIETLELALADFAAQYKPLASAQKKLVTNYKSLSQVKKDVSAAKRVYTTLLKAEEALEASSEFEDAKYVSKIKSAQSKYNSAYKAYLKLTLAQKSLVADLAVEDGLEGVTATMDDEQFAGKKEYDSSKSSAVVTEIEGIESLLSAAESAGISLSGSDTLTELQQSIEKVKVDYKGLTSFEKKLVHNYALVATASKHVSKASSAKKRLDAVTDEKKFVSAKKAFDKLQPVEKGLIIGTYLAKAAEQEVTNTTLTDLNGRLTAYLAGNSYDIETLKAFRKEMSFYSTNELKTLAGYSAYQKLEKDVKAVESFAAKMQKLGENPSYSQKTSIYKTYQKLTQAQQLLFENYLTLEGELLFIQLTDWMEAATTQASDLNNEFGTIIVNGIYQVSLSGDDKSAQLDSFEQYLDGLTDKYKALDSKERKLVVNYSYLKTAEKDIKAVRNVVKLELDLQKETAEVETDSGKETVYGPKAASIQNKIKKAMDKLTFEQLSLYKIVTE